MKHPSEFILSPFTDRLCDLHCSLSSAFIPSSEFKLLVPFTSCRNMIGRARLRLNYYLKAEFLTSFMALCRSMSGMGRGEQCLPNHSAGALLLSPPAQFSLTLLIILPHQCRSALFRAI